MRFDRERQRHDLPRLSRRELRRETAIDQPGRDVPDEVDDMRSGRLLDKTAETRAQAFERGNGREEGEEDFGT
jgi:hypothetical protein